MNLKLIGDALFKTPCLKNKEFQQDLKKVRKSWRKLKEKGKKPKNFEEDNQRVLVGLKEVELKLKKRKCREEVLKNVIPVIEKTNPDLLKEGGAYQIYMARAYLNGFLKNPEEYQDLLLSRVGKLDKDVRKDVLRILKREMKVMVRIILILLDEFEKMIT